MPVRSWNEVMNNKGEPQQQRKKIKSWDEFRMESAPAPTADTMRAVKGDTTMPASTVSAPAAAPNFRMVEDQSLTQPKPESFLARKNRELDEWINSKPVASFFNRASQTGASAILNGGQPLIGQQQSTTSNDTADTIADVLGFGGIFLNPGASLQRAGSTAATQALSRFAPKLGSTGNKALSEAAGQAAFGASFGAQGAASKSLTDPNYTFTDGLKDTAIDAALFGGGDLALRGLGMGIKKAADKTGLTNFVRGKFTPRVNPATSPVTAQPFRTAPEETAATLKKSVGETPSNVVPFRAKGATRTPQGTQAMAAPVAPLQSTGKATGTITRKQVVDNLRKNLGVTIRTGRLNDPDPAVRGYFKVTPEVIRTRMDKDLTVIAHEVGHHLDKRFKLQQPQLQNELVNLTNAATPTHLANYKPQQHFEEAVAEYFRLRVSDPQRAAQLAPQFTQFLEQTLPPKIKQGLVMAERDIATWINQGEAAQFRGQINRTGTVKEPIGDKLGKLYTRFVDQFDPLAKTEKAITGKLNDASQSLYKKARLSVGAPKYAAQVLDELHTTIKPLDDLGLTAKDLGDYAAAKHALELEQQGIQSGFTMSQIQAVLNKYQSPEIDAIQQGVVNYSNKLLDMLVDAQVLSQEAVNAMRSKYPNYVPFYRHFDEDMASGLGGGRGFANLTNPVKRLKGSSRDIIDPLESIVKNTFSVVSVAERNKVGLELAKLADVDGAGKFIERIGEGGKAPKENIVTVFEKGNKVQYQLDPELHRAMLQLDKEATNTLVKILSVPATALRAGATLTPEFMLRNPIRDQFQTFVVSNYGYNPIIDLPRGLFHVLGKTGTYQRWVKEGGGYGQYVSQDRNHLREELRKLTKEGNPINRTFKAIVNPKQWLSVLQRFSEITEEATKVGEFRKAVKEGATPQEAAFQSRDLMDFGRVGDNVKQINRVVAFLNANIQGKDRLARAFKNNPVRTTTRALTGITLPSIGLYYLNTRNTNEKQRQAYENAPQWLKDTFFLVPIPGTDELARIPKPFDLAAVFSSIPEQIMRYMDENDPQASDEFATNLLKQFSIPYMLTGLTPIIENITNYSFFTGGPIVPARDQDLLPEDQYGVNTSLTARAIGRVTESSPYKIDNLIRGYGAGLGRYATSGLDKLLETVGAGDMPPQEEKKWSELPLVNAFTVNQSGGGKVMDDFYKQLNELSKKSESAKKNKQAFPQTGELKRLESASRQISDIRKKYRDIQGSYQLTPEKKREQLDNLDKLMNELARQAQKK